MRAAIYARYSSSNQRETSIDDQISNCRVMVAREGWTIDPRHIYFDRAKSGASHDREALQRLRDDAEGGEFDVVVVDDLSRIARDSLFMAMFMADMQGADVRVVGVGDHVDTSEDQSDLVIQFRGIVNELYLKDLRAKTRRGLEGQKSRGFMVGEKTFGYRSIPKGQTIVDRHGRARPEGYDMQIFEEQARAVRRIFEMAASGLAINKIVKTLNFEGVKGMYRTKGWSPGSITRLLNNEKYKGIWAWNKTRQVRNRKTGKKKQVSRPRSEWIIFERPDLRIVSDDLWNRAHERRKRARKAYESKPGQVGFTKKQKGSNEAFPSTLLAGTLVCGECGFKIIQVSGTRGGYLGCCGATRSACNNRVKVRRTLAEEKIVGLVRDLMHDPDRVHEIIKRAAKHARELSDIKPEDVAARERELESARRKMENFVEFVGQGRAMSSLAAAMEATEKKIAKLEREVTGLRVSMERQFEAPPRAWVEDRLRDFQQLLESDVLNSALALRDVLGRVEMHPVHPDIGRSYYRAEASIGIVDLLAVSVRSGGGGDGVGGRGHENGPDGTSRAEQGHEVRNANSFLLWR